MLFVYWAYHFWSDLNASWLDFKELNLSHFGAERGDNIGYCDTFSSRGGKKPSNNSFLLLVIISPSLPFTPAVLADLTSNLTTRNKYVHIWFNAFNKSIFLSAGCHCWWSHVSVDYACQKEELHVVALRRLLSVVTGWNQKLPGRSTRCSHATVIVSCHMKSSRVAVNKVILWWVTNAFQRRLLEGRFKTGHLYRAVTAALYPRTVGRLCVSIICRPEEEHSQLFYIYYNRIHGNSWGLVQRCSWLCYLQFWDVLNAARQSGSRVKNPIHVLQIYEEIWNRN